VDNAGNLEFMRSLGADHVIDYTRENFTRNGRPYDLILGPCRVHGNNREAAPAAPLSRFVPR